MDLSTILGFVLGLGLIAWSMMHGGGLAGLALFVHVPAFMVVFGGSLAAVMIHFRIEDVKMLAKVMLRTFLYPIPSPTAEIERIITYANLARKQGLLALEAKLQEVDDKFFAKGIQLVIDGFAADTVRDIMDLEHELPAAAPRLGQEDARDRRDLRTGLRHDRKRSWASCRCSRTCPTPARSARAWPSPCSRTFYGAVIANVICSCPWRSKLDLRAKEEGAAALADDRGHRRDPVRREAPADQARSSRASSRRALREQVTSWTRGRHGQETTFPRIRAGRARLARDLSAT
jgi:chemotaxis protein MotA